MAGFDPNQKRDAHGRWTDSAVPNFIGEHGAEIAIGIGITALALKGYGRHVSTAVDDLARNFGDEGYAVAKKALTVRKVGPVDISKVPKSPLNEFTAWQYRKGPFDPTVPMSSFKPSWGRPTSIRMGAETVNKAGERTIYGSPKPFGFDSMDFKESAKAGVAAGYLRVGAVVVGASAYGVNKLRDRD